MIGHQELTRAFRFSHAKSCCRWTWWWQWWCANIKTNTRGIPKPSGTGEWNKRKTFLKRNDRTLNISKEKFLGRLRKAFQHHRATRSHQRIPRKRNEFSMVFGWSYVIPSFCIVCALLLALWTHNSMQAPLIPRSPMNFRAAKAFNMTWFMVCGYSCSWATQKMFASLFIFF